MLSVRQVLLALMVASIIVIFYRTMQAASNSGADQIGDFVVVAGDDSNGPVQDRPDKPPGPSGAGLKLHEHALQPFGLRSSLSNWWSGLFQSNLLRLVTAVDLPPGADVSEYELFLNSLAALSPVIKTTVFTANKDISTMCSGLSLAARPVPRRTADGAPSVRAMLQSALEATGPAGIHAATNPPLIGVVDSSTVFVDPSSLISTLYGVAAELQEGRLPASTLLLGRTRRAETRAAAQELVTSIYAVKPGSQEYNHYFAEIEQQELEPADHLDFAIFTPASIDWSAAAGAGEVATPGHVAAIAREWHLSGAFAASTAALGARRSLAESDPASRSIWSRAGGHPRGLEAVLRGTLGALPGLGDLLGRGANHEHFKVAFGTLAVVDVTGTAHCLHWGDHAEAQQGADADHLVVASKRLSPLSSTDAVLQTEWAPASLLVEAADDAGEEAAGAGGLRGGAAASESSAVIVSYRGSLSDESPLDPKVVHLTRKGAPATFEVVSSSEPVEEEDDDDQEAADPGQLEIAADLDGKPLLTVCTTFFAKDRSNTDGEQKYWIQWNTMMGMKLLAPAVEIVIFSKDQQIKDMGAEAGVKVVDDFETNPHGTPYLKSMWQWVERNSDTPMYGYTNGDILFGDELVTAVKKILTMVRTGAMSKRVLLVGRRTNYQMPAPFNSQSKGVVRDRAGQLALMKAGQLRGQLFQKDAEDYFFATRNAMRWHTIPEFVIGRVGYDNWLVGHAYRDGMDRVDGSGCLPAVHMTGVDGNKAGHIKRPDSSWNDKLVHGKGYDHGSTDDCNWVCQRGFQIVKRPRQELHNRVGKPMQP